MNRRPRARFLEITSSCWASARSCSAEEHDEKSVRSSGDSDCKNFRWASLKISFVVVDLYQVRVNLDSSSSERSAHAILVNAN
jgi:hypothetical protein